MHYTVYSKQRQYLVYSYNAKKGQTMLRTVLHIVEYVIVLGITIFLLVFFHNYFLFFLLVFLIVLPILSIAAEYYVSEHLICTITPLQNVVRQGQESELTVSVTNPTWIPLLSCFLTVTMKNHFFPDTTETIQLHIPAVCRQTNTVSFPFTSQYNGEIISTITKLKVHDMLGLSSRTILLAHAASVAVMPTSSRQLIPSETNAKENGYLFLQNSVGKGNSENMLDIREYQSGDRLQHIHWKLSAKKDTLLVKEFEMNTEQCVCILIDLVQDKEISDCFNLLYSFCLKHLPLHHYVVVNWWSSQNETVKTECLLSIDDFPSVLLEIYKDDSYVSSSKALDAFDAESIGFHSFYYLNAMLHNKEGGLLNE